jgi:hypothetical protein
MLPPRHKPFADELLLGSGIDSLSNLFVVFLTRYGSHLKTSWNREQSTLLHSQPESLTYPVTEISAVQSQIKKQSDEKIH